jgi:cobalt-zinc-cadmium efflux system protein
VDDHRRHGHGLHGHGLHGHGLRDHGQHDHDQHDRGPGDEHSVRLLFSIALNLLITVVEVIGGLISGSLALLSDALHNFTDTSSLVISYYARRVGTRTPDAQMTFGYRRAEIIGAFVNLLTLVLIALWLVKEAIERLANPQPISLRPMLIVATIGLIANLLTALLLHRPSRESINLKSAYLHIVMDAASSVGVIAGALIIAWKGWLWVDPILSFVIAGYIAYYSVRMLRRTGLVLMEAAPVGIRIADVVQEVQDVRRVEDAHHVHVWRLDEQTIALEAHVCIDRGALVDMEEIKAEIKQRLANRFGIGHSTLEFETRPCGNVDHEHNNL